MVLREQPAHFHRRLHLELQVRRRDWTHARRRKLAAVAPAPAPTPAHANQLGRFNARTPDIDSDWRKPIAAQTAEPPHGALPFALHPRTPPMGKSASCNDDRETTGSTENTCASPLLTAARFRLLSRPQSQSPAQRLFWSPFLQALAAFKPTKQSPPPTTASARFS